MKTELLLQMMEHPRDYSTEEWQQILLDEECRELYTLMSKTRSAIDANQADELTDETITEEWWRLKHHRSPRLKIAASFIGLLLISGIAFAAYHIASGGKNQTEIVKIAQQPMQPTEVDGTVVRFDNVQLDSVLTIVATHYQKQVTYRNDALRHLHFHIEWNQAAPLSDFINLINNFEGIRLREEQDTIIAE